MQSGVELKERKDVDGSLHLTITRQQESRDVTIERPTIVTDIDVPPSNKRLRTDETSISNLQSKFDQQSAALDDWLTRTREKLKLIGSERLMPADQVELIDVSFSCQQVSFIVS